MKWYKYNLVWQNGSTLFWCSLLWDLKHDIQTSDTENSRQHFNVYQQRELDNPHGVSQISQPVV